MKNKQRYNKTLPKVLRTACAALIAAAAVIFVWDAFRPAETLTDGAECEFHFIDVGQGDCSMFFDKNSTVVVDAGTTESGEATLEYIRRYTDTLDYLILTHPHEDHIGGAAELIEGLRVKNVLMTDAASDTYTFTHLLDVIESGNVNVMQAKAGEQLEAGGMKITVLAPLSAFDNYNNYSMVVRIDYGAVSAVVTGDAEKASDRLMLKKWGSAGLRADVLKLAHHGSSTSTSKNFLEAVDPKWAVISCGKNNSYGHPHAETLALLSEFDIPYVRTDELGTVVFKTDGKVIELENNR